MHSALWYQILVVILPYIYFTHTHTCVHENVLVVFAKKQELKKKTRRLEAKRNGKKARNIWQKSTRTTPDKKTATKELVLSCCCCWYILLLFLFLLPHKALRISRLCYFSFILSFVRPFVRLCCVVTAFSV